MGSQDLEEVVSQDINAIISFCRDNDINISALSGVWETNLFVRPKKIGKVSKEEL